eukprot:2177451-Lingulodinium_polyedra.AAC.1
MDAITPIGYAFGPGVAPVRCRGKNVRRGRNDEVNGPLISQCADRGRGYVVAGGEADGACVGSPWAS